MINHDLTNFDEKADGRTDPIIRNISVKMEKNKIIY